MGLKWMSCPSRIGRKQSDWRGSADFSSRIPVLAQLDALRPPAPESARAVPGAESLSRQSHHSAPGAATCGCRSSPSIGFDRARFTSFRSSFHLLRLRAGCIFTSFSYSHFIFFRVSFFRSGSVSFWENLLNVRICIEHFARFFLLTLDSRSFFR